MIYKNHFIEKVEFLKFFFKRKSNNNYNYVVSENRRGAISKP